MRRMVTCTSESLYNVALTRGKQYEVIEEKDGKVRLRGDNGRIRWYSSIDFDLDGNPAPRLVQWKFDYPSEVEEGHITEVTMQFSDSNYRWSQIATPESLKELLQDRDMEPGIWASHMIVLRSYSAADVSKILSDLDRSGELIEASRPLEFEEGWGPDDDAATHDWHLPTPRPERRYLVQKQLRMMVAQNIEKHEG